MSLQSKLLAGKLGKMETVIAALLVHAYQKAEVKYRHIRIKVLKKLGNCVWHFWIIWG